MILKKGGWQNILKAFHTKGVNSCVNKKTHNPE